VEDDSRWPPEELTCWADWAGPIERVAVQPEGRDLAQWATDVVADFYGDDWFAECAGRRSVPVMSSLYDWPLSSPVALVRHVERAARIALLPEDVRTGLTEGPNGIRRSASLDEFDHLDVVLEVIGLAVRDRWRVESEVATTDGHLPDLRFSRGGISHVVEVTTQGLDRESRAIDRQSEAVFAQQLAIEHRYPVQCVIRETSILDANQLKQFVTAMDETARAAAEQGKRCEADVGFASVVAYPAGERTEDVIHEGPMLPRDLWPRFAARLHQKAEATSCAGSSWICIDESGGLLQLTPAVHWSIEQQLSTLRHNVNAELGNYRHIEGVVISHGAEPDWVPQRRQHRVVEQATGAAALERRLPGGRRRKTFVIPVHQARRIALPDHLVLRPDRWYDGETSWLDWALNSLGQLSVTRLVTGELARSLVL